MRLRHILIIPVFLASCNSHSSEQASKRNTDSTQIATLMHDLYKWHKPHETEAAYTITGNDSLETGIDTAVLMNTLSELRKTNFFTTNFLDNYKRIGFMADSVLKHGKYYHEINFGFQDADPWNFFQDDAPNYWDSLIISDLTIHRDSAALGWNIRQATDNKYRVRLRHEIGGWKIDYLQGFDRASY